MRETERQSERARETVRDRDSERDRERDRELTIAHRKYSERKFLASRYKAGSARSCGNYDLTLAIWYLDLATLRGT